MQVFATLPPNEEAMRRMAGSLTGTSPARVATTVTKTAEAVAQVFAGVKLGEVIHGLICAKTVPPPARDTKTRPKRTAGGAW